MEKIQINLLLFGAARDFAGFDECKIEIPSPATIQSAYEAAKSQFKPLQRFEDRLLIALNEEYMPRDTPVNANDTLAIFPPVSGGSDEESDIIEIIREPIDYNLLKGRLLRGR